VAELLLVRHAPTDWTGLRYCGRSDPPLSAAGLEAAGRLGTRLAPTLAAGVSIVTSPSRRARQTATAIGSRLQPASIEIDERWAEADFGVAEGLTYDELERAAPEIAARLLAGDVEIDWPGGESAASLVARVEGAWQDLQHLAGPTIVVSHGGPLRIAIAIATGLEPRLVQVPEPATAWRLGSADGQSGLGESRDRVDRLQRVAIGEGDPRGSEPGHRDRASQLANRREGGVE
jgi:alpha-ribazole phosphatase